MTQFPDVPPAGPFDEDNIDAAEYVVGTLPYEARLAFEARFRGEPRLLALADAWVRRLAPLNDEYALVAAPDLMPRIEARLFGTAARPGFLGRLGGLIGGALAGAVAVAAVLVAVLLVNPPATPPGPTAVLAAEGSALVFNARYDPAARAIVVERTAGDPAPDGRDYELWTIGASGTPVAVGVIRGDVATRPLDTLPPGTTLAVSLEAAGGSTTGAPAEVLVTGVVGS